MLLLGGRSKVKKKRKFCLAVLGLVVMLVVSILPENMQTIYASECNNAYQFYNSYGNTVVFCPSSKTDGNIYYATKAATATTNTRYRTIGWKVSVRKLDGTHLQTLYFKLGGSYMNCIDTRKKSGNEYCLYSMSLYNLKRRMNDKAAKAMKQGLASLVLDACMIVVKDGKAKGSMNDNGPVSGKVYTDYNGIAGAANWSSASYSSFYNYFDKEIEGLFFLVKTIADTGIETVKGGGYYCYGTYVTIKASTKKGYDFEMWDGPNRSGHPEVSFYVNENAKYIAWAKRKQLSIVYHRNLDAGDTECAGQKIVYGDGGERFDPVRWSAKGKKMTGWALSPNASSPQYSLTAVIKDSWIDKYSPRVDLYAVWEKDEKDAPTPDTPTSGTTIPGTPVPGTPVPDTPTPSTPVRDTLTPSTPTPDTPEPDTPTPSTPTPDTPEPDAPTPGTPVSGTSNPDTPEEKSETGNEKKKIHCRFISSAYFEDESKNLIPREKGGLDPSSPWALDASLRVLLRQMLA